MSKRSERISPRTERTKWANRPAADAITSTPPSYLPPVSESNGKARWLILGVVVLVFLLGWGWYLASEWQDSPRAAAKGNSGDRKKAVRMLTEADKLVEQFIAWNRAGDDRAATLLAPLSTGEEPISEEEFERRAAGLFLRDKQLKAIDYSIGEPDRSGRLRATPNRYTIVTKGGPTSPHFQVIGSSGKPTVTSLSMYNPDIVVEVRAGKIHPLRTESHMDR